MKSPPKSREHDPLRLDVEVFANDGGLLSGQLPLAQLPRLAPAIHPGTTQEGWPTVRWNVRGERRAVRAQAAQIWLHVRAEVDMPLECQRCLQPVLSHLVADRALRFVAHESEAAALDAQTDLESDEDVLVLSRALRITDLIEEELLLALPLVPRHGQCPEPLLAPSTTEVQTATSRPFAALAALRNKHGGSSGNG